MPDWIPGAIYMPLRAGGAGGRANSGGDDPAGQSPHRYRRPRARDSKSGARSGSECARRSSPAVGRGGGRIHCQFLRHHTCVHQLRRGAILLAAIGIYGLVSYWVTQRTYEIGLCVAIGATRSRIISMNGIVAGVIVALAATRFLASLLYGIGATDSLTFAAVD